MSTKVSVIIPTKNEEKHIQKTLESILSQDYPNDSFEIIVGDGRSTDSTREIIKKLQFQHPQIQLIDNPEGIVSYALNYAIEKATGELIIRMDSHSFYPKDYISRLVKASTELNADNVGGRVLTIPANDGLIAQSISWAISNKFGIGDSSFRLTGSEVKKVDTVPFGCFPRRLFNEIGFFDTDLIRNQDDEFNGRIIKNGGSIYLLPDVEIKYVGRDKISTMMKMFYHYGLFKPLVNKKLGSPATARQFAPPLFFLFMLAIFLVPFLPTIIQGLWLGVLLIYFVINLFVSIRLGMQNGKPGSIFVLPVLFPLIHLSYGWGYFEGLVKIMIGKKIPGNQNFGISR